MTIRKAALLASISAFAIGAQAPAQAQTADKSDPTATAKADDGSAADIVVTGSRIVTNGNNLPTPVTIVTPDLLLKTSPSNIPDGLNKLPVFALSRGTANLNNPTDNFTGNYLNLRGIGIQRNLILLDGHRVPPTSYTGAVDTNVLPQLLLQRVDVVTGGASAVYGSDAVSGVVNFILDNKFTGLKLEGQAGVSQRGDAGSHRFGAAYGADLFGGAGHFEASVEHFQQDGISNKFDRTSGRKVYAISGSGTSADPFRLVENARNGAFGFDGSILSGPMAGMQFVAPGVIGPFVHGTPEGGSLESGGDGFYGAGSSATANLMTDQAFARFDYDLSSSIKFYVQGTYARAKTSNNFYPDIIFPNLIAADNGFLSPAVRAQLAGPFVFSRVIDSSSLQFQVKNKSENWMAATGISGDVGKFKWDLFYQHGVSTSYNYDANEQKNANLAASLDAVDQGLFQNGAANGHVVCRVTLTNPGTFPGCVPLNPFGTDPASQSAAFKYILGTVYNRPKFGLDDIEASLSGTAFEGWAGPVQVALSGEYRWLSLDVTTNAPAATLADCGGILFNCTQGVTTVFRGGQVNPISESEHVGEGALEVNFPLLKDSIVAKSLSVNAAARYTNYSTSGSVWTWKVGFDWQLNDSIRFRATRSRDIRAPSLYDLYQPATRDQSGYADLHTGFNGIIPTETAGNPNLVPEVANTLTFGTVIKPTGLRGFSMAVDYYRIKIGNAIASIDGRLSAIQNVCEQSGGTSTFCQLYDRPLPFSDHTLANTPTLVRLQALNASTVKSWGIDGELNYTTAVGNDGRLSLRGLVGFQPVYTTLLAPGLTPLKGAGAASTQGLGGVPKYRVTGFVSYGTSKWSIDVQERWRSSLKWDQDRTLVYAIPDVPSVAYTDLTLTAYVGPGTGKQIFFSAQNLFDKDPPVYLTSGTSGTPAFSFPAEGGDDIIGRYFTVGVRLKF